MPVGLCLTMPPNICEIIVSQTILWIIRAIIFKKIILLYQISTNIYSAVR